MKKMIIDSNNLPTAFYDTDIHTTIPVGAIDITDEQWQDLVDNQDSRKWDVDSGLVIDYIQLIDLTEYKLTQLNRIDSLAEHARSKYITAGYGQMLTYQEKSDEASDYLVAGSPVDLTGYPFIQAEVNATGKTATVASNDILDAQSLWITKGALIEEYRLKGKIDIKAALTIDDIDTISDNITIVYSTI